ncbi:MAG: DUF3137 domain-containing protein [Odoribacteraceae bacterium]|nr:DUF3137 domain-containing protein [Odoribacteraceae bacterium]
MKVEELQQQLRETLLKAARDRQRMKIGQLACYGGATIYFLGIILFGGLMTTFAHDYATNPNPTFWEANRLLMLIIPLFAIITIGGMTLAFFGKRFAAAEQSAVRGVIRQLFPDARCYIETVEVSTGQIISPSRLFDGIAKADNLLAHSFGSIVFDRDGQKLTIRDIIVRELPSGRQASSVITLAKAMFGGAFARRAENLASGFRGMMADAPLRQTVNGSVVIFPDHLEKHLDYLARSLQKLKNKGDCKLVQLEDPLFERYFAVYATDEITARVVLTPAMMTRVTTLREKYGRDIMLSFSNNHFYFAVPMPEGFLTLGSNAGNAVRDLHASIETARAILDDLKIKTETGTKPDISL